MSFGPTIETERLILRCPRPGDGPIVNEAERLTRLMWRPLCIAALNTPPERASANVFLAVLRDSPMPDGLAGGALGMKALAAACIIATLVSASLAKAASWARA